jgi:hypothetical protein
MLQGIAAQGSTSSYRIFFYIFFICLAKVLILSRRITSVKDC